MVIIKTSKYLKDINKKIQNKYLFKEQDTIDAIEELFKQSKNMEELMKNPLHIVYGIEKKHGNLKEIYTANINKKLRMYIKPIGVYPYNLIEINQLVLIKK